MFKQAFFACVLFFVLPQYGLASSQKEFDLLLSSEAEITITQFGSSGDRILWIPSEHGVQQRHTGLLNDLANLKYEIWLTRVHESYFMPVSRSSYTRVPVDDIAELIQKSLPNDNRKLYIATTGRGAALTLLGLKDWVNKTGGNEKFGGIVMIHPNFQSKSPTPGAAMDFLPVVDQTRFKIFIIQPKKSNKVYYLQDIVSRLSRGGSQVYTQIIKNIRDGFHVWSGASDFEKKFSKKFPIKIDRAIKLLGQTTLPDAENVNIVKKTNNQKWKMTVLPETLQSYPENALAPELELYDMKAETFKLENYSGKVVVLNFWATWCPPCVDEIPSLGRLQDAFSKDDLRVVTLNVGESKKEIEQFLKEVPTKLPILLDPDGSTVKPWKVIAFPTTFVVDKDGLITHTYFGGLEWDSPNVVKQLQKLIE